MRLLSYNTDTYYKITVLYIMFVQFVEICKLDTDS